jgi:hypothetical protein
MEQLLKWVIDMTPTRPVVAFLVLALFSTQAYAEGNENAAEQIDVPKPRIISSGQDGAGMHAFLAVTPKGPMVFMGKADGLEELDVLGMSRIKDGFVVDTLEKGELVFETGETNRVIKRGTPGFNSLRPSVVMGGKADRALHDQVMERIGGAAPKTHGVTVEAAPGTAIVRFGGARHIEAGKVRGPIGLSDRAMRLRLRARQGMKRVRVVAPRARIR